MRYFPVILIACLVATMISGCGSKIDLENHRQKLLTLNEKMRTAHLEGDVEYVLSIKDYPYVKVSGGLVFSPTSEEHSERFRNYLSSMKITAWDDLVDPVVIISDDASLATVTCRKYLAMIPVNQPDAERIEGIYAWQSTYRNTSDGWKQISDVLTSFPAEHLTEELESLNR